MLTAWGEGHSAQLKVAPNVSSCYTGAKYAGYAGRLLLWYLRVLPLHMQGPTATSMQLLRMQPLALATSDSLRSLVAVEGLHHRCRRHWAPATQLSSTAGPSQSSKPSQGYTNTCYT